MFQKARIKLTVWYLLIIMLISLFFSLVIFRVQMIEVERFARAQRVRIERQFPPINPGFPEPPVIDPDLIAETEKRLLLNMLIINGVIIVVSGGLGYFLAGKTLRPIKDMLEDQDRFISDSSHELRTPLTSLKTAMEVALMDKKLNVKEAKKIISENIKDVNKLQKLSDALIQLTGKKTKQTEQQEIIFSKDLVQDAIQQIKTIADKKQIIVKTIVKNIKFRGDRPKLISLLTIILDNAVKFSPKKKNVIIKAWKSKGFINISVKDQGMGISEKDLPHIFDRFYRSDSSRSNNNTPGYGLGLSIAKVIVDEHRGVIYAKNSKRKGAIFVVRLPL